MHSSIRQNLLKVFRPQHWPFAAVGLVALFFVVLMLVGAISNKEEGTLAGVDFKALADDASATSPEDGSSVWD